MVLKLKLASPAKFYSSSLPRPRIYTDVKFNEERVDPPVPVLDPLLAWANEAHWSMGGLSFKRLRLQGRIEGNVGKLRAERHKRASSDSPPPAPVVRGKRLVVEFDRVAAEEEEAVASRTRSRKLEVEDETVMQEVSKLSLNKRKSKGPRTSPRLANRRSSLDL